MQKISRKTILIDGREFLKGKKTGITRFLEGFIGALVTEESGLEILLAAVDDEIILSEIGQKPNLTIEKIPQGFLMSEKRLSKLSALKSNLFISPYPKLPIFGCHCPAINTIHDILDITHPAYKKRLKVKFDSFRLRKALSKAVLTWYVSSTSLKETEQFFGFSGKNPRVRHNGIDGRFSTKRNVEELSIIEKYGLDPGYILIVGNGLPHKNLGIILDISKQLVRTIVFVGVSKIRQKAWISRYNNNKVIWIEHVPDHDLPTIMRCAFCLAQPSTAEGYGYPPLEAMACGTPAIVSNIPVLKETTGGNALIASPSDPKDWIGALNALEDNEKYKIQNELGLKWVEPLRGRKGWQKHVSDIKEFIGKDFIKSKKY